MRARLARNMKDFSMGIVDPLGAPCAHAPRITVRLNSPWNMEICRGRKTHFSAHHQPQNDWHWWWHLFVKVCRETKTFFVVNYNFFHKELTASLLLSKNYAAKCWPSRKVFSLSAHVWGNTLNYWIVKNCGPVFLIQASF